VESQPALFESRFSAKINQKVIEESVHNLTDMSPSNLTHFSEKVDSSPNYLNKEYEKQQLYLINKSLV